MDAFMKQLALTKAFEVVVVGSFKLHGVDRFCLMAPVGELTQKCFDVLVGEGKITGTVTSFKFVDHSTEEK